MKESTNFVLASWQFPVHTTLARGASTRKSVPFPETVSFCARTGPSGPNWSMASDISTLGSPITTSIHGKKTGIYLLVFIFFVTLFLVFILFVRNVFIFIIILLLFMICWILFLFINQRRCHKFSKKKTLLVI